MFTGDPNRVGPKPTQTIFPPVAGIIYMSVPWWFDRTKPVRQKNIRHYFGSDAEDVWDVSPLDTTHGCSALYQKPYR